MESFALNIINDNEYIYELKSKSKNDFFSEKDNYNMQNDQEIKRKRKKKKF